jgi:hypothetical protein
MCERRDAGTHRWDLRTVDRDDQLCEWRCTTAKRVGDLVAACYRTVKTVARM